MTIAEDLVVLAHGPTTGDRVGFPTGVLDLAAAGAVMVDLTLAGRLGVEFMTDKPSSARLVLLGEEPVEHPVLDEWLPKFAEMEGKRPRDILWRVQRDLVKRLLQQLADDKVLTRRSRKSFGLIPRTSWPAADPQESLALQREVKAIINGEAEPDDRTAPLCGLIHACGEVKRFAVKPGLAAAEERAEAIARDHWAGSATATAVSESLTVVASVIGGAVAAGAVVASGD